MKSGDLSFMQKQFLQEAVDDPEFMEEFMSNHDHLSQRSKNYNNTVELPILSAEEKLMKKQNKLKN
jgi:hypothetical protein